MNKKVQVTEPKDLAPFKIVDVIRTDDDTMQVVDGMYVLRTEAFNYPEPDVGIATLGRGSPFPIREFMRAVDKQITEITLRHPKARRFCLLDDSGYDYSPLSICYLDVMTVAEEQKYRVFKERSEATAKKRKTAAEAKEKAAALKFLAKSPQTLKEAIKQAGLSTKELEEAGILKKPVNKEGTKTGRWSSKKALKSNAPKPDEYLEGIMNR